MIDGTKKGYIVHTNHPLGEEMRICRVGNWPLFNNLSANTLWRLATAKLHRLEITQ